MRRKYNLKMYQDKINIIKGAMSDACIGADVIVGFPGETNKDFENTYNFIEELKINYLHKKIISNTKR